MKSAKLAFIVIAVALLSVLGTLAFSQRDDADVRRTGAGNAGGLVILKGPNHHVVYDFNRGTVSVVRIMTYGDVGTRADVNVLAVRRYDRPDVAPDEPQRP